MARQVLVTKYDSLEEEFAAAVAKYGASTRRLEAHMHNTKALQAELPEIRKQQLAGNPIDFELVPDAAPTIDNPNPKTRAQEVKGVIEKNQLARQNADGYKMALFSGRVSIVKPGEKKPNGEYFSEEENDQWIKLINNEAARVVDMFPDRFIGVAHLPLTATGGIQNSVREIHRMANKGFVGADLIIAPAGEITRNSKPPTDKFWYPIYEAAAERNMTLRLHGSGAANEKVEQTTYCHYTNVDNWAVSKLLMEPGTLFKDFEQKQAGTEQKLRFVVTHGGGALFAQFKRARGVAYTNREKGLIHPRTHLESGDVFITGTVFGADELELAMKRIPNFAIEREIFGAAQGLDPETCNHEFDDVLRDAMVAALRLGLTPEEFEKMTYDNILKAWPLVETVAAERGQALSYDDGPELAIAA